MTMYRVIWEIDIDADSPREAAEKALAIQRNPESIATHFLVSPKSSPTAWPRPGGEVEIDFYEEGLDEDNASQGH